MDKENNDKIRLSIKTTTKTIIIDVYKFDSLRNLKSKIANQENIPEY